MSDVTVYRGGDARQAQLDRMSQPGSSFSGVSLREQFEVATAIANATEAVPRGYRKQPGAVLLALAWAAQHDLDVLTTMQGVTFIEGRAVVDATMQRALAKRAGYELRIGLGEDSATVEVWQHGEGLGAATYSMADAEAAELTTKKNWRHNREDMLVARATTRAVRRFAPDVLLGMVVSDELDDPPPPEQPPAVAAAFPPPFAEEHGTTPATPVTVPPGEPSPELGDGHSGQTSDAADEATAPVADSAQDAPPDAVPPPREAEGGPPPSASTGRPPWATVEALRAELRAYGITTPAAVRAAQDIAEELGEPSPGAMVNLLKASDELQARFAAWVRAHNRAA